MAPKLGKFAKRVAVKRAADRAVAKAADRIETDMKKAVETEAQRRLRTNKVPTKKEALERAEKIAKGAINPKTVRPIMATLVATAKVKQPPPYKAATFK